MTQVKTLGALQAGEGCPSTSVCFQSLSVFGSFPQVPRVLPWLRVDPDSQAQRYNWSFNVVKAEGSVSWSPSNRLLIS